MPVVRPFEGQPRRLRNTCDPAIYFCDASVVQPAIHTRFFDAVPTQLVGLGILVTFVGLAAGVGLASGSLASAEPAEIQLALSQLLNGASLAFMTSIFGLGSALGFLLVERGSSKTTSALGGSAPNAVRAGDTGVDCVEAARAS